MLINIKNNNETIKESKYGIRFNNENEKNEFREEFAPIKELIDQKIQNNDLKELNSLFVYDEGWGNKAIQYIDKNNFIDKKGFFKHINVEQLTETISQSKTKDVSDFRGAVYSLYEYANIKDYYSEDAENIRLFKESLNCLIKNKQFDKTKVYNIKWLIELLDDILKRLE